MADRHYLGTKVCFNGIFWVERPVKLDQSDVVVALVKHLRLVSIVDHNCFGTSITQLLSQKELREGVKKTFFLEISPKSVYQPTHPRVFVRFGKTKGEIRVQNGDFRGGMGVF